MTEKKDAVDAIVDQWATVRPELDSHGMAVIGRIHRLADLLEGELRTVFATEGLGNGDFDVLATLRRSGPPYRMTPGELTASAMVTSGAITKRVDRLAREGLVVRSVSEEDARGRVITLTEQGLALVDRLVVDHYANEARLVSALTPAEQTQLVALLRTFLRSLE
jgi:DNA-binding MarR family transcriptional regulator